MGVSITLQQVLYDRLSADNMFNGNLSANQEAIPVIQEIKGDVKNQVDTALARTGICAVILVPVFEFFDEYLWSLGGWMRLAVDIYEDVLFNENQTQIKAPDMCERIVALMQRWPAGVYDTAGEPAYFRALKTPWAYVAIGPPVHYVVNLQVNVLLPQPQP